jgi:hypothetical protein
MKDILAVTLASQSFKMNGSHLVNLKCMEINTFQICLL